MRAHRATSCPPLVRDSRRRARDARASRAGMRAFFEAMTPANDTGIPEYGDSFRDQMDPLSEAQYDALTAELADLARDHAADAARLRALHADRCDLGADRGTSPADELTPPLGAIARVSARPTAPRAPAPRQCAA